MSIHRAERSAIAGLDERHRVLLFLLGTVTFFQGYDTFIVSMALPYIGRDLGASEGTLGFAPRPKYPAQVHFAKAPTLVAGAASSARSASSIEGTIVKSFAWSGCAKPAPITDSTSAASGRQ